MWNKATFNLNKSRNINLDDSLTDNEDLEVTFKQKKKLDMEDDDFEITFKKPFELLSINDLTTPISDIIETLNFDDAATSNQNSIFEFTKEIEKAANDWAQSIDGLCTNSNDYIDSLFCSSTECNGFEKKGFINVFGKTFEFDFSLIAESPDQKYFKIMMKQAIKRDYAVFILNLSSGSPNFWPLSDGGSTPILIEKPIPKIKVETIKQSRTYIDYSMDIELDNDWDYLKNTNISTNRDREVGGLSRYFNNLCA